MGDARQALFEKVVEASRLDGDYIRFREAVGAGEARLDGIRLIECRIVDGVLYKRGLLWVPESLRTEVLREVYNLPASGHPGQARTVELLKRYYYWPGFVKDIARYLRNCYSCGRSKAPRNKPNSLLVPLPIPQKR